MTFPIPTGVNPAPGGPAGYTYSAVLVRVEERADARDDLLATLHEIRFSGWVAPPEAGWVVVVPAGDGPVVAAGRRGVVGVGAALAETGAATVAVRVLEDRQLVLVAWESGREVARYVSDPSREPGSGEDVLPDPVGTEGADDLAAAGGKRQAGEELRELLAEPLNPDEEIESERLGRVLRLLGLPSWLVSAWRLPRDMPTGPARRHLLRLRAGRTGPHGWIAGRAARLGRRWRRPPPVLLDPPRGDGGMDDQAMWL
jgi:hypothetical protein